MPKLIEQMIDNIHQVSEQMAHAAQAPTTLAQDISSNINQIYAVIEKTVLGTKNTEKSGHKLQLLANKLDKFGASV